ncbi:MAG: GNAT family N-acetyltransferase [Lachnospiraceae bacterium]|nr:GNAT family N-acetyltransferase [Lachnospiraceae bacterium]
MEIILEKAGLMDAQACMDILSGGRDFQREQGFVQWADNYPNIDSVRADILSENGFVLKADGNIAAYLYIGFDGEPAYDVIRGAWRTKEPYAVIHRVAFDRQYRGLGLSKAMFELAEEFILAQGFGNVRMDTHHENKRMQHVLEKNGFVLCGEVTLRGEPRLAYDKIILPPSQDTCLCD